MGLEAFEKAKIHFNHALKINSEMAEAWTNLGVAEHSLMRLAEAKKCFDAALRIDPSNIDAKWNKSHVLLTQGNYQEGLKLYEIRWQNPKVRLRKRSFRSPLWLGQEDRRVRHSFFMQRVALGIRFNSFATRKYFVMTLTYSFSVKHPWLNSSVIWDFQQE